MTQLRNCFPSFWLSPLFPDCMAINIFLLFLSFLSISTILSNNNLCAEGNKRSQEGNFQLCPQSTVKSSLRALLHLLFLVFHKKEGSSFSTSLMDSFIVPWSSFLPQRLPDFAVPLILSLMHLPVLHLSFLLA